MSIEELEARIENLEYIIDVILKAHPKVQLELQLLEARENEEKKVRLSDCCHVPNSRVEIVDSLGICGKCGEWTGFNGKYE